MIDKDDIFINKHDKIEIYIIGYQKRGESIIISIGNKFVGVIDCYKKRDSFWTKKILKETIKHPIDFLCWTHSDWDHTFGLSELKDFFDDNTHIIIPSGFQAKEFRNYLDQDTNKDYQYEEYSKILDIFDTLSAENYHTADQDSVFYTFALKEMKSHNSCDKYTVTINSFSPISKIIKDHNYNHIHKIYHKDKHWYENMNADNNLFSVGLMMNIFNDNQMIKICLTGDLTNETLSAMSLKTRERLFLNNTFLKIPHHGSENSDQIFSLDSGKIMRFHYAACTSFTSGSGILPSKLMLEKYKECGVVHQTNAQATDTYGIIKYEIPIINYKEDIDVSVFGNAGLA